MTREEITEYLERILPTNVDGDTIEEITEMWIVSLEREEEE